MLSAFFENNKTDLFGQTLTYHEYPKHFSFNNQKKWVRRKKNLDTVGRMYAAFPTQGEKYYLRLLLSAVKGPSSFEGLKTVNNYCYSTFKEACFARGIIKHEQEWFNAMDEAIEIATPKVLRQLFCIIIVFCQPCDVKILWEKYSMHMGEDILYELQQIDEKTNFNENVINETLRRIDNVLDNLGSSLEQFPELPKPSNNHNVQSRLFAEELAFNTETLRNEFEESLCLLNQDQKRVFEAVKQAMEAH